ncbi:MAG: hypothetical protein F4Y42_15165 [Caldilineaceae bacterium SB0664_bin_27]|uniref:Glycosyltransferase RgtA/B/C/D-like domain-containing protein n=1 Tax=Caldilineaceae bacterium SB0664_bin_27 TaxID=2605260 RepID=A0A6B0YVX4_9CHLR|nr:hypothetical protein [Caldilineaceae bacterium SB0664_bin_27]
MFRFKTNRVELTPFLVLLAFTVVALFFRLYRLHELEPGLKFDEGWNGIYALQVLQGEHALTFGDKEGLGVYLIALTTKLLGRTPLALRLPTALASASTVLVVFWLGRLLLEWGENGPKTRRRGLVVGAIGAGLLAVSLGQTVMGRTAYRGSLLPLFLALCLALLWWGWTRRRWWGIVLAGACAGLLPYTYYPARFVPILFLFFGLSFLLPFRSVSLKRIQSELPWAATFTCVAGLVAAPILFHYVRNPDLFFNDRIQTVFIFRKFQGAPVTTLAEVLAINVWDVLNSFSFRLLPGCCSPFEHAVTLNVWEALFFWLGVGIAIRQWHRSPAYRLLLLWVGLLFMPAFLSDAKSTMRMVGAVPAIYVLVAVGLWETLLWIESRTAGRAKILPWIFGTTIGVIVLIQATVTFRAVFDKGLAVSPSHYDMIWPVFAQRLNERPAERDTVYFIAHRHDAFDYLYQGPTPVMRIFSAVPDLDHQTKTLLTERETASTVKVVNWVDWSPTIEWRANFRANFLSILLDKHGTYAGTEFFDDIYVDSYVDVSYDRPWVLFEDLPQPVIYDGGITLEGLALGSSKKRASGQQGLDAEQHRSHLVGMLWTTASNVMADYSVSLRLYSDDGAKVFQSDHVLRKPMEYPLTTSLWMTHPVSTVFELEIPDELAAGEYELRMVVYDLETSTPTVEVGVWEPETALGRVQLQPSGQ